MSLADLSIVVLCTSSDLKPGEGDVFYACKDFFSPLTTKLFASDNISKHYFSCHHKLYELIHSIRLLKLTFMLFTPIKAQ